MMRLRHQQLMMIRCGRSAHAGLRLFVSIILIHDAFYARCSCGDETRPEAAILNSVARQIPPYHQVHSATFSRDGRLVVTAGNGRASIWDARTGRPIRQVGPDDGRIECTAFAPDDKTIAIASSHPEMSFLIGQESFQFHHIPDHSRLTLWDVETGELIREFEGEKGLISIHVADPEDRTQTREIHTFDGQRGVIESISFSHDGTTLLSGSRGNTYFLAQRCELKIWDVSTGKARLKLDPVAGCFRCAGFSRNGHLVTALKSDANWRDIDVISSNALTGAQESRRTLERQVVALGGPSVFLSPGAEVVAVIKDNEIQLSEVSTGRLTRVLQGSQQSLSYAAFSPDGMRIAANCFQGPIFVWDLSDETELPLEISTANNPVRSVGFSPDGHTIVSCGKQHLRFWNAESGEAALDDEGKVLLIPRSLVVSPSR